MKRNYIFLTLLIFTHYSFTLSNISSDCNKSCFVHSDEDQLTNCQQGCLEDQTHIFRRCNITDWQSQTFFLPRPVYDNVAAKQSLWHNIIHNRGKTKSGAIQLMPMIQDSISNQKIKRYFLFNHKKSLTVKGDDFRDDRDISAHWLGITDPHYNATLSIDPMQRQYGLLFTYQQNIEKFFDYEFLKNMWVQIDAPLVVSKTNICLSESFATCSSSMNLHQAFNQCDWKFAKIRGEKKTAAIPELILSLGTNMLNKRQHQIGLYSSLIIPTIDSYDPTYLFSPILGHNKHWGFATAVQFQIRLNETYNPDTYIGLFLNVENKFFIRNYQYRTFDLINKPWSRYLLFNSIDGRKDIPGVNILTLKTHVSPFNIVDLSAGFRVYGNGFEAEAGYNLWAHGSEQLRLCHPFPAIYGIAGSGNAKIDCPDIVTKTVGATASMSDISQQCEDDETFTPITANDIDLYSAASRTVITHKFHLSVGYSLTESGFIGFGFFFEAPHNNAMLKQWGAWGKIGSSF